MKITKLSHIIVILQLILLSYCVESAPRLYNYEVASEGLVGGSNKSGFQSDGYDFGPVVFIPGDGGSQLQARLNKTNRVNYMCDLKSDWYDIWLNIHLLVPYVFDCLVDNMRLHYNVTTRKTFNTPGVEIRPTNFGSLDSVDYLDIAHIKLTDYFENIIATLEKDLGLVRNENMVAAAFDFRKAPNELETYFDNLTQLIQDTYIKNNYEKVTLICHSMGCLNSFYFLSGKTENWKNVYIRRLITLAAPWDGSFKAISAMLFGDNLGIPLLNKSTLQTLQSSFPSLMYLFPKEPTFNKERVLIRSPDRNYTLENLDELFERTQLLDQREMWHDTREIAAKLIPPNVELWCLYGGGQPTPREIEYKFPLDENFNKNYVEIQGDGDGTVNIESLRACERFGSMQDKPVYTRQFDKTDHIDILRSSEPAKFIADHIMTGTSSRSFLEKSGNFLP